MRLEAQVALVAICLQSTHLPLPIHVPRPKRTPDRLVADHLAIFGMHVSHASRRQQSISIRERNLSRDQRVGGIPNQNQVRIRNSIEGSSRFGRRSDVAGVFILQPNQQVLVGGQPSQGGQFADNRVETTRRFYRSPIRKHPNDSGAEEMSEFESVLGKTGLIVVAVMRGKNVLLEAPVHLATTRQNAFHQRRSDRYHRQPRGVELLLDAFQLVAGEIHDVLPAHDAKFRGGHANLFHYWNRLREMGRKLIRDCGNGNLWFKCHVRSNITQEVRRPRPYTKRMFFRSARVKIPTFQERVDLLKQAGFGTENLADGRVKIVKHGVAAVIGDAGKNQPEIDKAGIVVGNEIAVLLSGGYQMFLETPSGKRQPATATELKALHSFEEDVKEALGLVSLYNTSLGTTSAKHMYDRVTKRDFGEQPKPWEKKRPQPAS